MRYFKIAILILCMLLLTHSAHAVGVCSKNTDFAKIRRDKFYPAYYLAQYTDLKQVFGTNIKKAEKHYYEHGMREGRSPNPFIDPVYYLNRYPDVKSSCERRQPNKMNICALDHWVTAGIPEGRKGSTWFDPRYYLGANADVDAWCTQRSPNRYTCAFDHWRICGIAERRKGSDDQPYIAVYENEQAFHNSSGPQPLMAGPVGVRFAVFAAGFVAGTAQDIFRNYEQYRKNIDLILKDAEMVYQWYRAKERDWEWERFHYILERDPHTLEAIPPGAGDLEGHSWNKV